MRKMLIIATTLVLGAGSVLAGDGRLLNTA
jgi:hypothetical protein